MTSRLTTDNSRNELHLDARVLQFLYCIVRNMKTGFFIAPKSHLLNLESLDIGGRHDPG